MDRDEWIEAFAARAGVPAPHGDQAGSLLKLAGYAAHASERTAAPLACWIAGRADLPLDELLDIAEKIAPAEPSEGTR